MKILISGGTGFIGKELVAALLMQQHHVYVFGRDKNKIWHTFKNTVKAGRWEELKNYQPEDFDAVINLAGSPIATHWNKKTKEELLESRIHITKQLVNWCNQSNTKKPHLYNASAIGIYGLQHTYDKNTVCFTEDWVPTDDKHPPHNFAHSLVTQWEDATLFANVPVTLLRFGVVLKRQQGMLKKLEFPTKLGLGSILGNGTQPISWINSEDLVNAILFLLQHPTITGPVNLTATEIVTQSEFTRKFADVFNKPVFLKMPAFMVKLLFGQMGEELLLAGQAVTPNVLLKEKFTFKYPTLSECLNHQYLNKN